MCLLQKIGLDYFKEKIHFLLHLLLFRRQDIKIQEDSQMVLKNKILTGRKRACGCHPSLKIFFQSHYKKGNTHLNLSFSKHCFHCYILFLSQKSFEKTYKKLKISKNHMVLSFAFFR